MRAALTQLSIDRAVPGRTPVDWRDTRLKGLVLRVMPGGSKSWYCEFARGKRLWLGRADVLDVADARERAKAILSEVFQGIDPIEARKSKAVMPTLGHFLENDYGDWCKGMQRAWKQNLNRLAVAFELLLTKRLDEITALHIERWRAEKAGRGLSNHTINRDIASIKACFNRAVDWGILPHNQLAKVRKARVDECLKVRYLNEAEERRLRAVIDAREERRRIERDSANRWRTERRYPLLPSLRDDVFTDHVKSAHPFVDQYRLSPWGTVGTDLVERRFRPPHSDRHRCNREVAPHASYPAQSRSVGGPAQLARPV